MESSTEKTTKPVAEHSSEKREFNLSKKQQQDEKTRETKFLAELNKTLKDLSPEAKATFLFNKYVEQLRENRKQEIIMKHNDKLLHASLKEKELIAQEYNKTMVTKSKLESLCRELQKCNKEIKEESLMRIKEEEDKRRETQTKFQKSLNEITVMMNENNEKNKTLRDDNLEMSKKFQYILEQYDIREKQIEKINKQLDLNNQLNDARMAKLQMEKSVEKELMLREKADLLVDLEKSKKLIVDLSTKERLLREQLNVYSEKYQDFQSSIQKSNNVFVGYKTEIEKMSKNMKKIDKESLTWKTKYEKSNVALLDLVSEKQVRDEHITKTAKQLFYLQKLCRTLQGDRAFLLQTLKEHEIECPTIPETLPGPDAEPVLPDFSAPVLTEKEQQQKTDKLDSMTKNCADLKENLKLLQNQLATMTDEKEGGGDVTADKSNKKSKSKNKKSKSNKTDITLKGETKELDKPDKNIESTPDLALKVSTASEIQTVNTVDIEEKAPQSLNTESIATHSVSSDQIVVTGDSSNISSEIKINGNLPNQPPQIAEHLIQNILPDSNVPIKNIISQDITVQSAPVQPLVDNFVKSDEKVLEPKLEKNEDLKESNFIENKT